MRNAVIAAAAALLLVSGVSGSAAQQWIQTTATDSVTIDGVLYPRASFTAHNRSTDAAFLYISARRLAATSPDDTCRAIRAVAPPGWVASIHDNMVVWETHDSNLPVGGSLSGFQLLMTAGHSTCFEFVLSNLFDSAGYEDDCFGGPDQPVPVRPQTWGAVKARYR
jgi:hypothetical protein